VAKILTSFLFFSTFFFPGKSHEFTMFLVATRRRPVDWRGQDDYGAEARGFVENSYLAGLTPQEATKGWDGMRRYHNQDTYEQTLL
jgi:hypothetical protein